MAEQEYITVQEALTAVLNGISVLPTEHVPLLEALGRVLAEPVVARDSLPPFANSSMDGYALRAADLVGASAEKSGNFTRPGRYCRRLCTRRHPHPRHGRPHHDRRSAATGRGRRRPGRRYQ